METVYICRYMCVCNYECIHNNKSTKLAEVGKSRGDANQ